MADEATRSLDRFKDEVRKITGEEDQDGHSADFVYTPLITVKDLLYRLNITVENPDVD